jgi:hypothetical protein
MSASIARSWGNRQYLAPAIDFEDAFGKVGQAAGLGADFDPFASEMNFLLGGMLFEDVGVTGYKAAAALIEKKEFLDAAAGILAVEAYHMGMVRSQLYVMGEAAQRAANAISAARDKLDGFKDLDQGVLRTARPISYRRTTMHCIWPHTATGAAYRLPDRQCRRERRRLLPERNEREAPSHITEDRRVQLPIARRGGCVSGAITQRHVVLDGSV